VSAMELIMESPVRAERPSPSRWQQPGEGELDRQIWKNFTETYKILRGSARTLRQYEKRIPHITTMSGYKFWNVNLLNLIVEQLNLGLSMDEALENVLENE